MNKRLFIYLGGLILLILDQFLKWYAIDYVARGGFFIWRFFEFGLYKNEGIAFGIKIPQELFYILVVIIIYFIFKKFKKEIKKKNILVLSSLTLIGAGAISNIIDRVVRGFVVDYLHFFNISAFNVADVVIVIGIGLLIGKELGLFKKFSKNVRSKM